MTRATQTMGIKAREGKNGRTYLDVPHSNGEISFVHPPFGYSTYADVNRQLLESNLEQPTMAQTASLVHAAWQNKDEKYSAEIIDKLRINWLWAFNGILYVPDEGAYIQDRPSLDNGKVIVDRINARFAPFGYKTGQQSARYLAKNKFVIALAGEEGAEELAQVADEYRIKPHVWSVNNINEDKTRVACLGSGGGDDGLHVDGDFWLDGRVGYAFGVMPSGKASAQKNSK